VTLVSIKYLLFLTIILILYRLVLPKMRVPLLTLASLIFIGFYNWFSLIFILVICCINFFLGKYLSKNKNKVVFVAGILLHTFFLFFLKYFHFSKGINFDAANFQVSSFAIALGISFYTLQNIAYLIEVFKDRIKPINNFFQLILFNAFFPKIISGPIESPNSFLSKLKELPSPNTNDLAYGVQRIAFGFFKKMVIADRLAPIVARTFDLEVPLQGFVTWTGICLFTIQLYFDFSGYIHIAVGSARLFGIRLSENFNFPLRANSISDFWRRWHITLIEWIKLYLYFPVVYRLRKVKKWNIIIGFALVFLLSGLWHGVGLTFFVWAICHIIYLTYEILTKKKRKNWSKKIPQYIYQPISIFITFNLVCLSELFFRASSINNAINLLENTFTKPFFPQNWIAEFWALLIGGGSQEELFNIYCTFLLFTIFLLFERKIYKNAVSENINIFIWIVLLIIFFVFGIFESGAEFIYLQF